MTYSETTHEGWFGRIGGAIKGMIFGPILLIIACILLFLNEGRAVHTARTLTEAKGAVVSVDSAKVDPANEGKLVHFTGRAVNATGDKLVDPTFHVSQDALRLRRVVLMYQWKEDRRSDTSKDTVGGGSTTTTTYSYAKVWNDKPIDSTTFKEQGHANPTAWRLKGNDADAAVVTAGGFTLNPALVGKIENFTPVALPQDVVEGLSSDLKSDAVFSDNAVFIANDSGKKPDPGSPQIGDLKISFASALPGDVSVIAQQSGKSLAPYQTKNNAIQLLYVGDHSAPEMLSSEEQKNSMLTWILRGAGFVLIFFGFMLMLSPLKVLADVVGIIGDIVGAGIGFVSFACAVALSCAVIAVAWIAFRPVIGISLFAAAFASIVWLFMLRSKGRGQRKTVGAA